MKFVTGAIAQARSASQSRHERGAASSSSGMAVEAGDGTEVDEEPLLDQDHDGFFDPQTMDEDTQLVELLLPWGVEQKLAMWLNFVKIPMICLVGVLGCVVETKVAAATEQTWGSKTTAPGQACYVNRMNMEKWLHTEDHQVAYLDHLINDTAKYMKDWTDKNLQNSTRCEQIDGDWRCEIIDTAWIVNTSFPKFMCHLSRRFPDDHVTNKVETCDAEGRDILVHGRKEDGEKEELHEGGPSDGYGYRLPYLPYSLVWAFFKLIFLPVHPIDRVVNFFEDRKPPSQPVFKLLTEPYCGGSIGGKVVGLMSMIIKIVRYTMLPNSMIVPLISMGTHPDCSDFFYYTFDWMVGFAIYCWVLAEITMVLLLYVLGKTVYKSKCVGSCGYTCYKIIWFMTSGLSFVFFLVDFVWIFNWRFWQGMSFVIRQALWISFDFRFSIDMVQLAASINVTLDFVSLLVMILTFLCPKFMSALFGGSAEASKVTGLKVAPTSASLGSGPSSKSVGTPSKASEAAGAVKDRVAGFFGKKK